MGAVDAFNSLAEEGNAPSEPDRWTPDSNQPRCIAGMQDLAIQNRLPLAAAPLGWVAGAVGRSRAAVKLDDYSQGRRLRPWLSVVCLSELPGANGNAVMAPDAAFRQAAVSNKSETELP